MLRWHDSCGDSYGSSEITLGKWTAVGSVAVSAGNGRYGTNAFTYGGLPGNTFDKVLDAQSTWIAGIAYKAGVLNKDIIYIYDGATLHVKLVSLAGGQLRILQGDGTTLATSTNQISSGVYYFIELKGVIADSGGSVEVKVNGSSWANNANCDTRNGGNATADTIRFLVGETNTFVDDPYICDGQDGTATQGAANNTFLGDYRTQDFFPNSTGNYGQWTASAGDNYTCVDEASPNADTDYVETSSTGNFDTYGFQNISTGASIKAIQLSLYGRKTDAGVRTVVPVVRSSGTDFEKTAYNLPDSYSYQTEIVCLDPATTALWTSTGFNAAEFGYKLNA